MAEDRFRAKDFLLGKIRSGESLTRGQQIRLSLMLSLPAIIAQLSSIAMQYIDTSMIGHLSSQAGASIALVSTCLWLLGGFCFACCSGFSVQVAHFVGADDFKAARSVVRQALLSSLVWSGGFAVLGLSVAHVLPFWLGGTEEIAADASKYFFITCLFIPIRQLNFMAASLLQCSGNMKVPSALNIGMCFLDVVFNYIFIYVLGMGVTGAAVGTGVAESLTAVAMLAFLLFGSRELRITLDGKSSFIPTRDVLSRAFRIGMPMCLENIVMRGAYIAGTVIVAPLGTIAIAANGFAVTAESLCYMPGYGIADAATTLVGQSLGAGRKDLANRLGWMNTFLGMALMSIMGILMYIFAPQMMSILSPDPEIIGLGAEVLRIEAFAETMYAASIVAYGVCVGAGDTLVPSIMNFGSMWIFRIVPAIFLTPLLGLKGYWIAMAFELNVRGIIFLARLKSKRWARGGNLAAGDKAATAEE